MLVDLPIRQGETLMFAPQVDGTVVARVSEETIRRAYCELVTREVEARSPSRITALDVHNALRKARVENPDACHVHHPACDATTEGRTTELEH